MRSIIILALCTLLHFSGRAQEAPTDSLQSKPAFPLLKGTAFLGFTGGANTRSSENEAILGQNIINRQKDGFNITLNGGYLFTPSFAVGGSVRYEWLRNDQVGEDADGIQTALQEAGNAITGAVFIKNFIPLTQSGRFNLYNIIGLGIKAERNTLEKFTEEVLTRNFTEAYTVSLGIAPGIQVFILDGFATEVGVNIAGLSTTTKKTTVNGEESTRINSSELDLKLNILSLNLSFYYYFKS